MSQRIGGWGGWGGNGAGRFTTGRGQRKVPAWETLVVTGKKLRTSEGLNVLGVAGAGL